jgi:hypothetical protein
VLSEVVPELTHANRSRRVRSSKRKGAVPETICKTPILRPRAVGKRGSELREAKQVNALVDVGFKLWKYVSGKRKKGHERGQAIKGPSNLLAALSGFGYVAWRATVGRCGGSIAKVVVIMASDSAKA